MTVIDVRRHRARRNMGGRAEGGFGRWRALITAPWERRARREIAYTLLLPAMAGIGLAHLVLVLLSVLLTANLVGVPMLALSVRAARGVGAANRRLARTLAGVRVADPAAFRSGPGLANWLAAALGDVTGWRAVIHGLLRLPAAGAACAAAAGSWGGGLLLLGHPWWGSPPSWRPCPLPACRGRC
ncbi:sensor domain-containing protein [Nonomuraea antimicrobica]